MNKLDKMEKLQILDNNLTLVNETLYIIRNSTQNDWKSYKNTRQMAHQVVTMDYSCRLFQFCISFIMVGVTCTCGFIGNTLSILALHRDSIKSVTTFLLSALAVADIMFLVPAVFVIMVPTYCEFYQHCTQTFQDIIPYLEQFGWAIASTCHTCTVYVTVLVAIHIYFWVCKLNLAHRLSGKCVYPIIINISHCITTKLY